MKALFSGDKTILSLCDYSGEWSKPYKDAGYNVILVDLKYGQDVRLFEYTGSVYGILAAPPCTHFAGSGARWWKDKTDEQLIEGLSIVDACMRIILITNPVFWALENPVGRLTRWLGKYRMTFNPCDYGDPYTKRTCLWGNFNTDLKKTPVVPVEGSKMALNYGGKSERTKELRSITPAGFANAFYEANG